MGLTPLHIAAERGHLDIIKIFVYREASLAVKDQAGKTAEDIARSNNKQDIADYLHTTAPLTQQLLKDYNTVKDLLATIAENSKNFLHISTMI